MRSRYGFREAGAAHFITGTVAAWLPVFTTAARCDILAESLKFSREKKGLKIYAWVILDNHFHAIVEAPDLSRVVMELKRYTAHRMIEQLEQEGCEWLLHLLAFERAKHKRASEHHFWQEGSHPQALTDDAMMEQKLDYIHNNPVKRGLVSGPEHWRYSSAHEWLAGASPVMACDRWR
jgi:putative transposase